MHTTPQQLRQNPSDLPWVVQKYGGTSVGKFLDTIASDIVPSYLETNRVVIVCSARSGETKEKGTTNQLLRAAEEALTQGSNKHLDIVKELTSDHLKAARSLVKNQTILEQLEGQIQKDCMKLRSFLQAAEIIDEISPRSRDIIAGIGELLSCSIVTAILQDKGIDSRIVCLNNIIDREFETLDQEFYDYLSQRLGDIVRDCGDRVPVLTGFFGNVPGSLLNAIGRGYTDLCAALVAVGLNAQELQIWKEVDGVFTADPRKVPGARLLSNITPEEAAELTYYGSEVIHPFTMEQVIRAEIPIRIKNVENPAGSGTIIYPEDQKKIMDTTTLLRHKLPTAVTIKDNICVLNVHSNRKNVSHGFLAKIFATLDEYGVVVDLISTSEVHVSMALGSDMVQANLDKAIADLELLGTVDVLRDMAILSLVGKHMKNTIGTAGKMFTALASAGVNIEIISQGASEINISCVVDKDNALSAMKAIHKGLLSAEALQEIL
ncbi:Aspartate/glutamate/uridylate kinase [Phascolomyces articulosus]|uniref:Aspartokinase n=1 Tax=Phascolomyces articulosus TaxID=60185 RepID=A0AAD5P9I8_9FUNG|nr:Aspartate/glutamate/uridylate kinase [Phascolomyces articulosus]